EKTPDYYIDFYTHIDTYRVKKWDTPFSRVITEVRLPQGVDLYSTNFQDNRLVINAKGLPPRGGTITLKSRETGRLKYVIVASITGRVRVSDHPPESWEES
ncbi:MAG: hypothetical protein PWQ39_1175, partial [Thermacetogenium sp.]|nr:hypothetical protein [Thermacetogenium sp.]